MRTIRTRVYRTSQGNIGVVVLTPLSHQTMTLTHFVFPVRVWSAFARMQQGVNTPFCCFPIVGPGGIPV